MDTTNKDLESRHPPEFQFNSDDIRVSFVEINYHAVSRLAERYGMTFQRAVKAYKEITEMIKANQATFISESVSPENNILRVVFKKKKAIFPVWSPAEGIIKTFLTEGMVTRTNIRNKM